MFVAYFMDRPYAGTPLRPTGEACNAELRSVGVRTLLMDPDWRFAAEFRSDPDWTPRGTLDLGDRRTMEVPTLTNR